MTKRDRPFVSLEIKDHIYGIKSVQYEYSTYRLLKKNIKLLLLNSVGCTLSVTRFKRGEWGEWFERWELHNGKPVITKQGWM